MNYIKTSSPKEGVALIELNRPEKRNALNNATLQEIATQLQAYDANTSIKVVVITGNAQCFAAGADLNELIELDTISLQTDIRPTLWKGIDEFSKPLLMAVNGYALGAGFELVLHGDIVVTGENAQFALPEIRLGMLPGAGGMQRLARLVGQQLAMRWAMTGERISASSAQQHGITTQICPTDLTVQYTIDLAANIVKQAPLAIRAIKQSLKSIHEVSLSQGLKQERQLFVWLAATQDREEGIRAFLEKRQPSFRGV
jgi:enoyl-CoA hydratase